MRRILIAVLAITCTANAWAGPWPTQKNTLWMKWGGAHWGAKEKFAGALDTELTLDDGRSVRRGDRVPFDPSTGGRLSSAETRLDARYGITTWADVGFSVPYQWVDFDTEPVDTVDGQAGIGDIILSTTVAIPNLPLGALAFTLDLKLPTGAFDPSVFNVPLSEGQMDIAPGLTAGLSLPSFGRRHAYASAYTGYRIRMQNKETTRTPGDEWNAGVEIGMPVSKLVMVKVAVDMLRGKSGTQKRFGITEALPRRRLTTAWLGFIIKLPHNVGLEMSARQLLSGEDMPTGTQLFVALSRSFNFAAHSEEDK